MTGTPSGTFSGALFFFAAGAGAGAGAGAATGAAGGMGSTDDAAVEGAVLVISGRCFFFVRSSLLSWCRCGLLSTAIPIALAVAAVVLLMVNGVSVAKIS